MVCAEINLCSAARAGETRDHAQLYDFQALSRAFDASADERQALEAQIAYYKETIKRSLPSTAAQNAELEAQINALFSEAFHGALAVAIFTFSQASARGSLQPLPVQEDWTLLLLEQTANQQSVLVITSVTEADAQEQAAVLFSVLAEQHACSVAYSDFSSNPLDIARLFDRAKQAQIHITGKPILAYSDIVPQSARYSPAVYPYQVFDAFTASLGKLDFDAAEEQVQTLFGLIAADTCPPIVARCVMMDILTSLYAAMSASDIKYEQYKELLTQTLSLCRSPDFSAVETEVFENIWAILVVFKHERENIGLQLPQVLQFVDENCYHPDFTLAYLADHFGVSSVYMSSFFTKRMHVNLSDYLWELRLQRSKKLLETTDLTIERIAAEVGYDIVSSFRRKFKQEVGISPSEYRRRCRM